jgi:Fatty acid desaturase
MPKVTFSKNKTQFHNTLKNKVDDYFKQNNISKTGDWRLYSKTIILVFSAVSIYFSLLYFYNELPVWSLLLMCSILGLVFASIGFNIMHDACHGSYSKKEWLNNIMGYSLNVLGGNSFIWKQKHNIIHHTYTNVDGVDDDIAKSPLIRQCYTQKWVPAHRFQHIYLFPLYAISSIAWIFLMDFKKFFEKKIYTTKLWNVDAKETFIFWLSKIYYVIAFIVIPIWIVGLNVWAIGFFMMHITMGLSLALVFQLAHVVEGAHFEFANGDLTIENDWAIHQVLTTANFAPKNLLVRWYVGGLNYQIEHHLFPRISHVHYPDISKIVKEVCAEFDIPYNEFSTTRRAVISHLKTMRDLGKAPAMAPAIS